MHWGALAGIRQRGGRGKGEGEEGKGKSGKKEWKR
jgi:hypothetical protein